MKNLRDILIVVAVGATLFFPCDADAKLFGKRKAKKAAKRAATVQYTSPDCTITGCPTHSQPGTGRLGINSKGGFTGQLSDQYYADYYAQRTSAAPEPIPAEVPDVPEEAAAEISIVVASAGTVADAEAAVRQAEMAVVDAKAMAERAVLEQQQANAKEVLELQQQIDDLTARLAELQPE